MDPQEITSLKRSLAMLPAQAAGLNREEAMRLLSDLQDMDRRMRQIREVLEALIGLASGEGAP